MPMDADTRTSRSATLTGAFSSVQQALGDALRLGSTLVSSSSTANSSPPSRAAVSLGRSAATRRWPITVSS